MDADSPEVPTDEAFPTIETNDLKDIPVCWILRSNKLVKMFKCRYCPHVNLRRINIQEHERMHSDRPARPWESVQPHQRLTCEFCSYTCNNAGVLSSHLKVHQVEYARVCALVDPYRKDDEQIKELTEKFNLNDNFPAVDCTDLNETDADGKDSATAGDDESTEGSINIRSLLKTTPKKAPIQESPTNDLGNQPEKLRVDTSIKIKVAPDEAQETEKVLRFCQQCPARFLYEKELNIHSRFHNLKLPHQCRGCSYTARQDPHLQAHFQVHTEEYQERTKALLKLFSIHEDHPMPLHTFVKDAFIKMWIVPSEEAAVQAAMALTTASTPAEEPLPDIRLSQADGTSSENTTPAKTEPKPKHNCSKCPAKFFKPVALQYHLTLHGANHPHKCRVCDYAVKTYGNLAKHEVIHGPREKLKQRPKQRDTTVPISGTDLFQHRNEANKKKLSEKNDQMDVDSPVKESPRQDLPDALEESLYQGCPDFVYPTYLKNGRLKEKKYKCHKCPSAFEKREQYRVHLSLHGSNQRYSCNKCDYSVKYYANYVQHLQKHSKSEEAKAAAGQSALDKLASLEDNEGVDDEADDTKTPEKTPRESPVTASPQRSIKTINRGPLTLSVADRQTMMVMQQRRANRVQPTRDVDKNYWCLHCPYNSARRDGIDSHMKRHMAVSGVRNVFLCDYCDFSVPTQHFIREHTKLHFAVEKLPRPDTFMTCDKLELWVDEENREKKLIFQDKGDAQPDRFVPALNIVRDEGDAKKVFVNPSTGETISYGNGDVQPGNAHEWDSCSESTNRSEVVVAERNGEAFPASQSSLTSDVSDSASSTGSSSGAGSDIEDDSTVPSIAATVNVTAAATAVVEGAVVVSDDATSAMCSGDADKNVSLANVADN